jgi:hypothetical protein
MLQTCKPEGEGVGDAKARSKPWKTFLEKSFPNLPKNFNLKPRKNAVLEKTPYLLNLYFDTPQTYKRE